MRTLNVRLFAIVMLGTAILAAVGVGVHAVQVQRHRGVFLEQANRAKADGRILEAIDYLQRYVLLARADDVKPLADLGMLQADAGRLRPAYDNLEAALRTEPDRGDVRRRAVGVAMAMGRFSDARVHLELLLKNEPDDGPLLDLLAQCQQALGDQNGSLATFRRAIEKSPEQLDSYARLALLLRNRLDEPALAQEAVDQMVTQNPESYRAYVLRGTFLLERPLVRKSDRKRPGDETGGTPDATVTTPDTATDVSALALDDARKAAELAPDEEVVLEFLLRCLVANDLVDEARTEADRALRLFPKSAWVYALLANIELQQQRIDQNEKHRDAAIDWLTQGLAIAPKPQQPDLLWNQARLLIETGRTDDARQPLERLQASEYPKPPLTFLETRIMVQNGQWLEASGRLERLRPALLPWPDLMKESDFWLGRCYEALGKTDLQLTAYRRAASVDPQWIPARLGIANALRSMGRVDEALEEYRRSASMRGAPPAILVQLARLMILSNFRRNESERNWQPVLDLLDEVDRLDVSATQTPLLRAEILVARNRADEAEAILQAARDRAPDVLEFWIGLASLAERQENWQKAAGLLTAAQAQLGDVAPLRLARARQLVRRERANARPALREMAQSGSDLSPSDQLVLYAGLSELALTIEDFDEAERLISLVAERQPNDLRVRLLLFDLAVRAGKTDALERVLAEVQRIEGTGPLWHYGQAVRLAVTAESQKRRDLHVQAREHLREARIKRPAWSRVPLLAAQISDADGDEQAAIADYLKAIELGERSPRVIGRAVKLLFDQKRFTEADLIIRRQQDQSSPFSQDMARLAADIALRLDDGERAVNMTKLATDASTSAGEFIWAGQVLRVLGAKAATPERKRELYAEAEASFHRAIALDESAPGPWVALIQHLGATTRDPQADRSQQSQKLAAALADAEVKIAPEQVSLALAEALESLGRTDEAEARYRAALAAATSRAPMLRKLAEFCLRHARLAEAQTYLTELTAASTEAADVEIAWARRNLALILLTGGTRSNMKQALTLINENLSQSSNDADLRAKAAILATSPERSNRDEAVALLEQLLGLQKSIATEDVGEERLMLARLYAGLGNHAKALEQMRSLMASHGDKPRFVTRFVQFLLGRNELADAELWTRRLESLAPHEFPTFALSAEILFLRDRYEDLLTEAERFPGARRDETERQMQLRRVASLLEDFSGRLRLPTESVDDAGSRREWSDRLLSSARRNLVEYTAARPIEVLALAAFDARHGQADESLDVLEKHWHEAGAEEITTVTGALLASPQADRARLERAEKIVRAALEKHNRPVILVLALADLCSWREGYDEAESLYREVIERNDRSPIAFNNLALLLALRGRGGDDALNLVDRALDLVADDPSLLDSRATILLARGDAQRAAIDLKQALDRRPSAHSYFHQAQASLRLGQPDVARESLQKAIALGLNADSLHPLERPLFLQLRQELQ